MIKFNSMFACDQAGDGCLCLLVIKCNSMLACHHAITGVHSNRDQIWLEKIGENIGFYFDRRP